MRSRPLIAATATAVPDNVVTREDSKAWLRRIFPIGESRLQTMEAVIDHSRVERRYFVHPVDYIIEPRPLVQVTREYGEHSVKLGRRVTEACLSRAGMSPKEIDLIVTVSCTGFMIPSLDAHLINDFGFRAGVRRLPITELGCAAGASALSYAANFIEAFPDANVLVVSVELASLSFQRTDLSAANLISSALFGDGASAAVVRGSGGSGPAILATQSYTFPQSLDAMGFDLKDTGFHIVLSRDVPFMVQAEIKRLACDFLSRHQLQVSDISAFVLHPGGQKLLAFVAEELGLRPEDTAFSWRMLRDYGNLSSASVGFVLHDYLNGGTVSAGDYGLMAAFGPGFSAEMLLLQWQ
jgi:alkylresorcinol/alkylpyrone synthase